MDKSVKTSSKSELKMSRQGCISYLRDDLDKLNAITMAINAVVAVLAQDDANQDVVEATPFTLTGLIREGLTSCVSLLSDKAYFHYQSATCLLEELSNG